MRPPNTESPADTPPAFTRRRARAGERDVLRLIHHTAYRDVVERQFGPWNDTQQDAFFDENMAGGVVDVLVVEGAVAGYCHITDHPDRTDVEELVIAPPYQGRGLGSAVLRDVMVAAAARDVPVHLQTHRENRAARLYRRHGFVEVGRTPTHIVLTWRPPSTPIDEHSP